VANFGSISAIGRSIERFLKARFHSAPSAGASTTSARLVRTEDFDPKTLGLIQTPFLSISMYRVDFNNTTRAGGSDVGNLDGRSHLPVGPHYLLVPVFEKTSERGTAHAVGCWK